ncbi:MAG: RnfABCDGE type electron transport complex subunit D [Candidatus Omnitrophota bacterium]|nr:RnfABCDGE type electron transport complex subunit D [Candidatus Omnitrophota bacterium]
MTIRSIKVQLGIFLILFALYLSFISKETVFLSIFGISLIFAIAADSFITYLKTKKLIITESSVASGLIIGYVLSSSQAWWIIALASILAISSKHFIRFKSRHVFNPAGFGILMAVFLLGASTEWKGAYLWYIIIPFGIYFSFRIRKLELIAGYLIASLILFGGQALIQKVNILDIFGYLNYFFIFIMLIEPMTTPAAYYGKIIFGAGTGALIFILYLFGIKEAELLALLFFNLSTPLLNKRREK